MGAVVPFVRRADPAPPPSAHLYFREGAELCVSLFVLGDHAEALQHLADILDLPAPLGAGPRFEAQRAALCADIIATLQTHLVARAFPGASTAPVQETDR